MTALDLDRLGQLYGRSMLLTTDWSTAEIQT